MFFRLDGIQENINKRIAGKGLYALPKMFFEKILEILFYWLKNCSDFDTVPYFSDLFLVKLEGFTAKKLLESNLIMMAFQIIVQQKGLFGKFR